MDHEELLTKATRLREKKKEQGLSAEEQDELTEYVTELTPGFMAMLNMNEGRMDARFKKLMHRVTKEKQFIERMFRRRP